MKRAVMGGVVLLATLMVVGAAAAASQDVGGEGIKEHAQFGRLAETQYNGGIKAGSSWKMEAVAHVDLAARGYNADVLTHEGYAYVGQWGFADFATGNSRFCPSDEATRGAAIIDARVPAQAKWVSRLLNPAGTSIEDIVVFTAKYGPYAGRDIAAAGLQYCAGSRYDLEAERGLMLWDVTIPESPVRIGYLKTACCTRGVHELEVQHRADLGRTFVYGSVPASRYPDVATITGVRDVKGDGDFRLFDITNPTSPQQVSEWAIQDAGDHSPGRGAIPTGTTGTAPSLRPTGSSRSSPTGTAASWRSTSRTRRTPSTKGTRSTAPTRTSTAIRRSTTRIASSSSPGTRTSVTRPAPASKRATATCACGTTRSWTRRSR